MGYILGIIILVLIGVIVFLCRQMRTKDYHYQYKANKMETMEADYENKI